MIVKPSGALKSDGILKPKHTKFHSGLDTVDIPPPPLPRKTTHIQHKLNAKGDAVDIPPPPPPPSSSSSQQQPQPLLLPLPPVVTTPFGTPARSKTQNAGQTQTQTSTSSLSLSSSPSSPFLSFSSLPKRFRKTFSPREPTGYDAIVDYIKKNGKASASDATDDDTGGAGIVSSLRAAVEAKKAGNTAECIENYEKVIGILLRRNNPTAAPLSTSSSPGDPVPSQPPPFTSSFLVLPPPPSPPQAGGSTTVTSVSKKAINAATDLMSALESASNVSTIDYVNDKVDFHERLGGGGSGAVVLRATCKGLTFAVKLLPGEMPPEVREGVLSEISVMTQLDHQNVARYLGHDISKHNKVMLYMEYYTETLSGVLKKRKAEDSWTTPEEVTKWSMQVAKGLQYLHSLSPPLIHRDLKSENVFVLYDSQGRVETLKIGDFDTAKITEKAKATFTKNLGTVGFMAPEVCNPTEKGYNEKADSIKK